MAMLKINRRAKKMAAAISPEKVTEKVTENQRKILEAVEKNPHITAPELAGILGISERKTKENIKKLKERALLKRIGPDKGGHWEVAEK